jgi:Na+/H+ antiporter NhaA
MVGQEAGSERPTPAAPSSGSVASPSAAANVGLLVAVVLMIWSAGRAARVRGKRLVIITSLAAALGVLMILLKDVVLSHLR